MTWYTGVPLYDTLLTVALGLAVVVIPAAWVVPSSYGRFSTARFGLRLKPRLGWLLMELPATLVFFTAFALGARPWEPVRLLLAGVWLVHYANRGFLFPLLMRSSGDKKGTFSLMVVAIGWLVTSLHGYLNGTFIGGLGSHLTGDWLKDPRLWCGLGLYYLSFGFNLHSDHLVRRLRSPQEAAAPEPVYRIPQGGLFRWVTNPSYLTELTAWAGWALATWSLAGVFILVVSAANLVPRALDTHRWYRRRFPDYPPERKVLIPFIW